jgi:streptogramin lyase
MNALSSALRHIVVAGTLVLLPGVWHGASAQVTLFSIPTATANPSGIAAGPDGNLWFTEQSGNKIGQMTPNGGFAEFLIPSANAAPFAIAAGSDGNLWFTEAGTDKIGRITPSGAIAEFPLPRSQSGPTGIATGVDGALWFGEGGENGNMIGRITTAGAITEFPIPTADADPFAITAGPDGALWFVEQAGNKIGRIAINGTVTEVAIPTSNAQPAGITAGPDGNLWFTEQSGNNIGQITISGTISEFPVPNASPSGIAAGPDGALWFAEPGANAIGRITTTAPAASNTALSKNCAPTRLAFGADKNLYFNCTDPSANAIGQSILPALVTLTVEADPTTTGFGLVTARATPLSCQIGPGTGAGAQTGTCIVTAYPGTPLTLTAGAHGGFVSAFPGFVESTFAGWTAGCSGTGPCSLVLNGDMNVAAKFASLPEGSTGVFNVGISSLGGATGRIISTPSGLDCPGACNASFPIGAAVSLTATPGPYSSFTQWISNTCPGTGPCSVTLGSSATTTVYGVFSAALYFDNANAATLPVGRAVTLGSGGSSTTTVFGTLVNSGVSNERNATDCAIQPSPLANFAGSFVYQTTDPTTNALTGTANTPVNIPIGGVQSFVLAFTPTLPFAPTEVPMVFACANIGAAPVLTGLNTVLLSASTTAVPDIVALGATPTNDQILHIGSTLAGAFAVATVNLGAASQITASADTGASNLPVIVSLCQTNPQSGQCLAGTLGQSVTTQINSNATPTFAVFVQALKSIPFDPANSRVFVSFFDQNGAQRGGTSVAVETQ